MLSPLAHTMSRRIVPTAVRSGSGVRCLHIDASSMAGRSFISLHDYSKDEIGTLIDMAAALKAHIKSGGLYRPFTGKNMSMLFSKRSTRTRVSSETGFATLGGHPLFLGSEDIQLGVNESLLDSARVLGRFNDLLLARVFDHSDVETLAAESGVPVINALSDLNHPLQTLADILTLRESFGSTEGLTMAWVGDGNNIVHSLMAAGPKMGYNLRLACPDGYKTDPHYTEVCKAEAAKYGTTVYETTDPVDAVTGSDVIVTDTWISMGQEEEAARRLADFEGYQVTMKMAEAAAPGWKFLHCLPRKPYEVDDEVFFNTERSLVWNEAENRKWTVMAVQLALLNGGLEW